MKELSSKLEIQDIIREIEESKDLYIIDTDLKRINGRIEFFEIGASKRNDKTNN